jgi:hypothetical protein
LFIAGLLLGAGELPADPRRINNAISALCRLRLEFRPQLTVALSQARVGLF